MRMKRPLLAAGSTNPVANDLLIIQGDARAIPLADSTVQCVVTSPPYWGLRKYSGDQGAEPYGLEPSIDLYIQHTVEILREIRRVLRPDGVVFLNLGDSYASGGMNPNPFRRDAPRNGNGGTEFRDWKESGCVCSCHDGERSDASLSHTVHNDQQPLQGASLLSTIDRDISPLDSASNRLPAAPADALASNRRASSQSSRANHAARFCSDCLSSHGSASRTSYHVPKPKDLCLIPERVALAAQADGWWVRSRIIWVKPNPMPESCTDRPTDAYEHIIMLTKSERYFWDADAVREPAEYGRRNHGGVDKWRHCGDDKTQPEHFTGTVSGSDPSAGRNMRNVWTFPTQPYKGAHFATFPEELPRRCILAATSERGACIQCGAPWERVTERLDTGKRQKMADGWDTGEGAHGTIHREGREAGESGVPVTVAQTIGWRPGCECRGQHGRTRPCLVLDPFGGSGTTARVAVELNRRAVSLDLAYHDHAEARTRRVQRRLLSV